MANIGEQLRKCQMDNGYSQEYVSEKLEISRQTLSNWENDRSQPTLVC